MVRRCFIDCWRLHAMSISHDVDSSYPPSKATSWPFIGDTHLNTYQCTINPGLNPSLNSRLKFNTTAIIQQFHISEYVAVRFDEQTLKNLNS